MIDFVIDANILLSILISGKSAYRPILQTYNFIVPDFALIEIEKYSLVIFDKTKLSKSQLITWSYFVFSEITVLPRDLLDESSLKKSNALLSDIDLKDISYVALAMQLNLPLLTRDKVLYEGLKKKGFRKTILFENFLENI